ncbi:hypothetical protein O181_116204 [Austropuccinia psidii MF-1]|uniref:Integrase catalytic domain-containing protein n=1 Tax=Austropuccinia psidii MF-1 TaxID=1389203 RepID=A0A9Q3KB22_9BASI|nr:hypothetical protein [Austropuccinia psidii MF-1]
MTDPSQDTYLSTEKKVKIKTSIWWPVWKKYVEKYCKTFDRCQKEKKSSGHRLENMIQIQQQSRPWEIVHIDWVTCLPQGGDKGYNSCTVIADRLRKTPIFFPCQKDDTAMDTALLIWKSIVSRTGIFIKIIIDRDSKLLRRFIHTGNNNIAK